MDMRRGWRRRSRIPGVEDRLWEQRAACGEDPDLFFSDDRHGPYEVFRKNQAAKRICAACPVKPQCREKVDRVEGPLPRSQWHGVWAEETPTERLRRRRRDRGGGESRGALPPPQGTLSAPTASG